MRPGQAGGRAAHSRRSQSAAGLIVVDLPLQDDEQEEQPQQDVPQVAEDVVEGAGRGDLGDICLDLQAPGPFPTRRWAFREPNPLAVHRDLARFTERRRGLARQSHLRVAQRVGTEEVVKNLDVCSCDIYCLQWEWGQGGVRGSS